MGATIESGQAPQAPAPPNVVCVDPVHPDDTVLQRAARIIRRGGLVAFPTETVYGLGANALDARAVDRIFAAKQRARDDPLIVHLAAADQLESVARDVPAAVRVLAAWFWPGPLTVVLPKQEVVPANVTAGLPTVAVRVPRHAVAQGLLRAAGVPIAAPSANLFMRASATTAAHVLEDLGDRVDLILDGGPADAGIESTVIAVEGDRLRLLRPGATPVEAILRELAAHQIPATLVIGRERGQAAASPGLMAKHYSPRARLLFFSGPAPAATAAMRAAAEAELARGRKVGLLLYDEDCPVFADLAGRIEIETLGAAADLATVARRLFACMRRLDARGVDVIGVRSVPPEGLGRAIVDRLTRAATVSSE